MEGMVVPTRVPLRSHEPGRPLLSEAEGDRLAALRRYRILDTPAEEPFNRLAMLACDLLRTEIALVSFVDETRQWFKARIGLGAPETPRDSAFCAHAIAGGTAQVFVVPDAGLDPRFAGNPLVTGEPHLRFYAAAPMCTPDGFVLGTVCVVSATPRPAGISEAERRWLAALAGLAMDELELRLQARRAGEAAAAEARLRRAQEAAGVTAFEASSEAGPEAALLPALRRLFGLEAAAPLELRGQPAIAQATERPRLEAVVARLATAGGSFLEEFRVTLADGGWLWAQVDGEALQGRPAGWRVSGLLRDVTERRQSDDRQVLMTRELDHRAKNALAVVLAALRLTPAADPRSYAAAVEGRVAALARAHTLLTARRWTGADLHDLVRGELRAASPAGQGGRSGDMGPGEAGPHDRRLWVEGPAVLLAAQAAQPLAIALHELATNAARHGALSAPAGQVAVTWSIGRQDGALHLAWRETGGPPVAGAPGRFGFGWRVMRASLTEQLGGRLDCGWAATGLVCEVALPAARVLADAARSLG